MKKFLILSATVSVLVACHQAAAQETPPPAAPPSASSFLGSVKNYFTSFNTNLDSTFASSKGSLWTGADSIQGGAVTLANSLGIAYNAWRLVSFESVTRNSGVAGTLVSEQAGIGLNFVVHDARLTLYGDGGYDFTEADVHDPVSHKVTYHAQKFYAEIGARAQKALTEHTFAGVGIGAQLPRNRQVFSAFAGFTF